MPTSSVRWLSTFSTDSTMSCAFASRTAFCTSLSFAVKRAGLDYWHLVNVQDYENLDDLFARHPEAAGALWLATTKAPREYTQAHFTPDSWLFFGKETAGLPEAFRTAHRERCIRLPMRREARSLNLSNSVAILTYEALRQNGFPGLTGQGEMAEE